jgi:hypothetical protein
VTKFALLSTALAAILIALLSVAPAQASNAVSFVSSTGTSTICTRVAPCGTFQAAHDVTVEEGEIHCLDSGPFGAFGNVTTISISVTIDCADMGAVHTGSFVINGTAIVVTIRNLSFNNISGISGTGIDFQNGAVLYIENCVIQNFSHNPPYVGIKFEPSVPGAHLHVTDTIIKNSGNPINHSAGGALVVSPQSGGTAQVALNRITVAYSDFGIVADGTGSTGGINMTIADSVTSGNSQDGIVATTPSGGAPIGIMVKNTKSANNGFGIRSIGSNVTVRVDSSSVIGNGTGLSALNGGALLTFGNNAVRANGTDGAFSGSIGLQ